MRLKIMLLITSLFIITGIILSLIQIPILTLMHRETSEIIYLTRISPGDEFTIKWMHSVELQPWEEIFKIDENYNMILDRTRFKSFGAGVPAQVGTHGEIKDGWVIFSGINKIIPEITYGISDFGKHVFVFEDHELKLYEMVPDGDGLHIDTTTVSLFSYLLKLTN